LPAESDQVSFCAIRLTIAIGANSIVMRAVKEQNAKFRVS
jgi:hypothetical protein